MASPIIVPTIETSKQNLLKEVNNLVRKGVIPWANLVKITDLISEFETQLKTPSQNTTGNRIKLDIQFVSSIMFHMGFITESLHMATMKALLKLVTEKLTPSHKKTLADAIILSHTYNYKELLKMHICFVPKYTVDDLLLP